MRHQTDQVTRYSNVAIVLHWSIAVLIIFNLIVGVFMEDLQMPWRRLWVRAHMSAGIAVLVLTLVRVVWRLLHRPPPLAARLSPIERRSAHIAHVILYVLMVAMPLTGWALVSSNPPRPEGGYAIFGGLVILPQIPVLMHLTDPLQEQVHDGFVEAHAVGAWITLALLCLHIAGALKHQVIDRQPQLARMWINKTKPDAGVKSPDY